MQNRRSKSGASGRLVQVRSDSRIARHESSLSDERRLLPASCAVGAVRTNVSNNAQAIREAAGLEPGAGQGIERGSGGATELSQRVETLVSCHRRRASPATSPGHAGQPAAPPAAARAADASALTDRRRLIRHEPGDLRDAQNRDSRHRGSGRALARARWTAARRPEGAVVIVAPTARDRRPAPLPAADGRADPCDLAGPRQLAAGARGPFRYRPAPIRRSLRTAAPGDPPSATGDPKRLRIDMRRSGQGSQELVPIATRRRVPLEAKQRLACRAADGRRPGHHGAAEGTVVPWRGADARRRAAAAAAERRATACGVTGAGGVFRLRRPPRRPRPRVPGKTRAWRAPGAADAPGRRR